MFRIKLGVGSYTNSKEAPLRMGWPFWTYSLPKISKNSHSDSAKELVLIWVHWTYASALMYPRCLGLSLFFSTNWGYQSKRRFRRRSRGSRKKTERQKRQRQKRQKRQNGQKRQKRQKGRKVRTYFSRQALYKIEHLESGFCWTETGCILSRSMPGKGTSRKNCSHVCSRVWTGWCGMVGA